MRFSSSLDRRLLGRVTLLSTLAALAGCSPSEDDARELPEADPNICLTPLDASEPLCNGALASGPWAISHRNGYAQGASPEPGPVATATMRSEHVVVPGIPVVLTFTPQYDDGERAIWATLIGLDNAIVKVDDASLKIIDLYVPSEREADPPNIPLGLTGAYSLMDGSGRFVVARANFVSFYGDETPGDRDAPIALQSRTIVPTSWLCGSDDVIAGIGLTYDGAITLVTERGNVVVVPSGDDGLEVGAARVASINGENGVDCDDPAAPVEEVSNNIAVDEDGGIYVVTSGAMYRYDHDAGELSRRWRAAYETEGNVSPIRLGAGSGSTPSLMGTDASDDRFVVITDGQQLMHLVFMWRDEIPDGWTPIAPGKDPRIACEVPIDFGQAGTTSSSSEQSVLVRRNGAVVVNNLLRDPTIVTNNALAQNLVSALEGGQEDKKPLGVQRIDWDPSSRTCTTRWAASDISIPNGIPTMSTATNLFYGIGRKDGAWGVQAMDFDDGAPAKWWPNDTDCADANQSDLGPFAALPEVTTALNADPQSCENSLYAATTVGPDGVIYTGTIGRISRYIPDEVGQSSTTARGEAGLAQARDLLARARAISGDRPVVPGTGRGRDELVGRAVRQLLAVLDLGELDEALRGPAQKALETLSEAVATPDDDERVEAALDAASNTLTP